MTTLDYKNSRIETVLSEDNQPVYVAIIDGTFATNATSDSNEEKCIEKAKKAIDNSKKRK